MVLVAPDGIFAILVLLIERWLRVCIVCVNVSEVAEARVCACVGACALMLVHLRVLRRVLALVFVVGLVKVSEIVVMWMSIVSHPRRLNPVRDVCVPRQSATCPVRFRSHVARPSIPTGRWCAHTTRRSVRPSLTYACSRCLT